MILILRDCAGERLTLKVVLGMSLANWLKSLVLAAEDPYGVFLRVNGSLGELGYHFGGRFVADA